MDSRTRCSVLISFHRRLRDRDGSPSLLPVTTAGVPPMRRGRRRRPPRRCACPPARTRRGAEPGPQRAPAPFGTTLRLRRDPGGTNENNLPRSVRSASEFILMSSRLSHWDTTFSCTLCGRCVEVSRYSPYLRPSAAICTTVSVESRPTSSRGSAEQMLCASSTTTRQGSRECRDRHSVDRTAWVTSCCSAAVPSDPRSTTVHRAVGSRSSATSEGCCGSQMLQSNKPMLRARRPSARAPGRSGQQAARCR